ncbi:MAG TPA: matrixin family metalloprotease [Fimbriimonadaceae bacterium]|nr:matrixin family metalloprotease [Fimbriimonadaceae bacterium]
MTGLTVVASASVGGLPSRVSGEVRDAVDRASLAYSSGDRQQALALLEGSLYPDGITLAVDESTVRHGFQETAVKQALDVWGKELDGDFPVTLVDDPAKADVVLTFVDKIDDREAESLGIIKLKKNYSWNHSTHQVKYRGTIRIVRSAPGGSLNRSEVRSVAMHEIGHLLGLDDSSHVGALMGPMERGFPASRPSDGEIADVKALRQILRTQISQVNER